MINKILKELDHMIKFQEKEIELDMQAEELEGKIHFETAKLLAYDEVARMIKKSEIRKLVVEIFDLSLRLQEMTDGTIDWREPGVPCVQAEYHGATAVLSVKIWENGFSAEQRPDYSTMLFLNNPNCMIEAWYLKEKLMGLLEERRGNDNGKDDSDHN